MQVKERDCVHEKQKQERLILECGQSPIHQDFNYENTCVLLTEKYNELPTVRDFQFVFSVKLVNILP